MTLRDAILRSQATGCEFWRASEAQFVFRWDKLGLAQRCAAGEWHDWTPDTEHILADDWQTS